MNSRAFCEELVLPYDGQARPALWFYAKILDLISHILLEPLEDFCCQRKERVALERIASVKKYLTQNLLHPPSLIECSQKAGCSSSYLSRTFSEYTGMTMSRYIMNLRLEQAAELLRSGKYNVTEAAMAVGYLSLSHFSKAFAEMFGCCPCVFGFSQKKTEKRH
jgi:AraC-like DNA-binding protein